MYLDEVSDDYEIQVVIEYARKLLINDCNSLSIRNVAMF